MQVFLVSHSHWDREWYRTFQDFRARLVDLIDHVLELCAEDPGYRFLLDGQTIVLEDYLEIRPSNADTLRQLCSEGRIAIGPWYVQPDSLLPSGEAHVRNLLLGRQVGESIGPVSRVGYTPDSFGHPAQFPQLFAGFGIDSFVYWRGNGNELDELPAEYDWVGPEGSRVIACHLGNGYFSAATSHGADLEKIGRIIADRAQGLAANTQSDVVLLMNGIDHAPPEARTPLLAREIAACTGFDVKRGLLSDFVATVRDADTERPRYCGDLIGGRVAPLLPGVWSTRTWIKLANRKAETMLEGWAEPFAALAQRCGLPDERPALRLAWKELLKNQAHDSICGCSRDEVHEQMRARYDTAYELAEQTTKRCLERLAGLDVDRHAPWTDEFDILVANPSAHPRTDRVRLALDFHPFVIATDRIAETMHATILHDLGAMTFIVDGQPARLVPAEVGRMKLLPERKGFDLEFIARDVPAFGFRRVKVRRAPDTVNVSDTVETLTPGSPEAVLVVNDLTISVCVDGRFDLKISDRTFHGLGDIENTGDRGDSYDYDEVRGTATDFVLESVFAERRSHASGITEIKIVRRFRMPERLDDSREARSVDTVPLQVETVLRAVPDVERVDVEVRVVNAARDHRLRMLFPVGRAVTEFDASTTFDVVKRTIQRPDDTAWVQRAPSTFPHQGFVHAAGLTVVAPGLPEVELIPGEPSQIAVTLLRCIGSLSRADLRSRLGPAGPGTDTPNAQCAGEIVASISLFSGFSPARARDAELGLRAVSCGPTPLLAEGMSSITVAPSALQVSAIKPAEDADAFVIRVLNPSDEQHEARVAVGFPFERVESIRLDEDLDDGDVAIDGSTLVFTVEAHALRTLRIF